jgi:carbohydrate kinase (thermoresistant glucokinase family)
MTAPPATPDRLQPVVVVMGVCGSGKTVIGSGLAHRLKLPFIEGDALHPAANVAKMASGVPLTDKDRWPWLDAIAAMLDREWRSGHGAIAACSALKRVYRDRLRSGTSAQLRFLLLDGPRELIAARMTHRSGHFMPPSLLDSQLAILEPPEADEFGMHLDISRPVADLLDDAVAALARLPR